MCENFITSHITYSDKQNKMCLTVTKRLKDDPCHFQFVQHLGRNLN